jgi:DUF2934 family protein
MAPRRRRKDREPARHVGDSPVATPVAEDISAPFKTSATEPPHDDIARRAYELYEQRGGEHGHDWEDWFYAERELRQPAAHQGIDTSWATESTYAAV